MRKNRTFVPTEFGPETRFELRASPAAPFRATQETEFERLKSRLLVRQLAEVPTPELIPPLRRAANEAAALAWVTTFPCARPHARRASTAANSSPLESARQSAWPGRPWKS